MDNGLDNAVDNAGVLYLACACAGVRAHTDACRCIGRLKRGPRRRWPIGGRVGERTALFSYSAQGGHGEGVAGRAVAASSRSRSCPIVWPATTWMAVADGRRISSAKRTEVQNADAPTSRQHFDVWQFQSAEKDAGRRGVGHGSVSRGGPAFRFCSARDS